MQCDGIKFTGGHFPMGKNTSLQDLQDMYNSAFKVIIFIEPF